MPEIINPNVDFSRNFVEAIAEECPIPIEDNPIASSAIRIEDNPIASSAIREEFFCFDELDINNKTKSNKEIKKYCVICGRNKKIKTIRFKYYICDCLCEECIKSFFSSCEKCGNIYEKKDFVLLGNNQKYCYRCVRDLGFRKCHKCNQYKYHQIYDINNDYPYCVECLQQSDDFFKCNSCDNYFKKERYGEDGYCISCVNSRLREVRNYSYKPEPRFFKSKNTIDDNLYFGIELEMGCVKDPDLVNEFVAEYSNNFFYMKKDTSIPIYGCEIVTQPATLSKHLSSNYWKSLLKTACDYGFNAEHEKCGVHVHVSRNFFSNDEIAKLDCFVNSYCFWKKLARRESHYSAYVIKNTDSWGMQTTNRRCALNLSNDNTIEFRIFKGTLKYEEIMAYIEACYAASLFVKNIDENDLYENKNKIIDLFINYIKNNKKLIYLWNYCIKYEVFS